LSEFSVILVFMNAKERMQEWKKLPTNTISWETFKRLVGQFGTEEGVKKAQKIIEKKSLTLHHFLSY